MAFGDWFKKRLGYKSAADVFKTFADHQAEHEKQRAAFKLPEDDVLDAIPLTPNELFMWNGNTLTMVSSNVHQIRYDSQQENLYVAFKETGDLYVYEKVPFKLVMEFVDTDSPGRFVWRWLREGTPPYKSKYNGHKVGSMDLSKGESQPVVVHVISSPNR